MKKFLWAAVALMALAPYTNVKADTDKNEPLVRERRELKGFERIELLGSLDVEYRQSDKFSVVVKAPKDVVKRVETRVDGKKLVVSMKGERRAFNFVSISSSEHTKVYVTSPDFTGIELRGSGDFECKGHLDTDLLDIQLKGSGDVEFEDVVCDGMGVTLVGSGDVEVKHVKAQRTGVELVGSGDVKINQQNVGQTQIELKGSGDIKMSFANCGTVTSRLVGSGDITLSGDVARHSKTARGSGDIHTRNLTIRKK